MKKLLKIQYLLHLKPRNFRIMFLESYSLRVFQQYQEDGLLINLCFDLNDFLVEILFNIQ
jgi:hypothetical protein